MSKYINAPETKYELSLFFICDKEEGKSVTLEEIEQVIDRMESADVVEVVRCKDCHFYDRNNNGGLKKHGFCEIYKGFKTDDGFCDLGEREETE